MYYTINEETDQIIDQGDHCPDPQEQADFFSCSVYIIQGQHSGLRAEPSPPARQCTCGTRAMRPDGVSLHYRNCELRDAIEKVEGEYDL